jgi:hypothetical protein
MLDAQCIASGSRTGSGGQLVCVGDVGGVTRVEVVKSVEARRTQASPVLH